VPQTIGKEVQQSGTIDPFLKVSPIKESGMLASVQQAKVFDKILGPSRRQTLRRIAISGLA
jgi:hypothetical protein